MHLQGYIDKKGYSIKTMHLADVLSPLSPPAGENLGSSFFILFKLGFKLWLFRLINSTPIITIAQCQTELLTDERSAATEGQ